jgi:hypothetical protein
MSGTPRWVWGVGLLLHILIAALMIFAASGKLFGSPPPEVLELLRKVGLDQQLKLIGTGELITALLLLIPWTSSLGVLLASGFWGGAICTHMSMHDSYTFQSILLALTWLGALLRLPEMFSSFWWRGGSTRRKATTAELD